VGGREPGGGGMRCPLGRPPMMIGPGILLVFTAGEMGRVSRRVLLARREFEYWKGGMDPPMPLLVVLMIETGFPFMTTREEETDGRRCCGSGGIPDCFSAPGVGTERRCPPLPILEE